MSEKKENNNNDSVEEIIDNVFYFTSNYCVIFGEDTNRFNIDESITYILAKRNNNKSIKRNHYQS